jgi:predicted TIM-barrel fold metal-dependent hydrolase
MFTERFYDVLMQNYSIIDSHIHCDTPALIKEAVPAVFQAGIEKMAVLSYGHMRDANRIGSRGNSNPAVLAAKSLYPDRVFAFGGINHFPGLTLSEEAFGANLLEQAKGMIEIGFDGVKLIETKPAMYVTYPFRLHEPVFDRFFGALEEEQFPVLWHVGDPATFWDPEQVPVWAKERDWYYGEGDFPSLETLYEQSQDVLIRHPRLKVTFAHFYFLADDLQRLGKLFATFPNVRVDITPGTEMYTSFSSDVQKARKFFNDYGDRILFGTDIMIRADRFDREDMAAQIDWMRRFLETDDTFDAGRKELRLSGLALPEDTLRMIYADNFRKVVGEVPRVLNRDRARAECDRISALFETDVREGDNPDVAQEAKGLIT